KAAVLKLNALSFKKISFKDSHLEAGSGLMLGQIVKAAQDHGLSGIEFLAGIPGTVGGALIMNAGAWGKNIADAVSRVKVMDYNGKVNVLKRKDIKFAYRSSSLEKFIILSADFKLSKRNKKEIKEDIKMLVQRRRDTQDLCFPSAGCIFKNPEGGSAGRLIDLCGLKSKAQGRAYISSKHANFILNQGGARAADVLKLMDLAQRKVKTKFKLTLKPEIKIWH
ncbi:MAG: UDP-N-acetylmuramate dehydrogenase, partial [Candidatus Omnitrophica bacterium]|nr:UDP-N-acetylmuramate dehydrogenase [Candidatus Omnitrophota bacterium]